jgi:hypothetical protein
MRISRTVKLCEVDRVNATRLAAMVGARAGRSSSPGWLPNRLKSGLQRVAGLALVAGFAAAAQSTNPPARPNSTRTAPGRAESGARGLDESAFRIVAERNIFNADRSGGQVRLASQRPARIETFTLVGTMAYAKGVFAFFEGSNSEFTKALKADGVIAGHKLLDIYANGVKLEADGKEIDLPVGGQMRREDEGTWHVAESSSPGNASDYAANRNGDSSSREAPERSRRERDSSRSRNEKSESARPAASNSAASSVNNAEVLKRLMERRAKESQ